MSITDFQAGDRVALTRVRHKDYQGKTGTVKRVIKSRNVVKVVVDGINPKSYQSTYDALPENLDRAAQEPAP